MSRNILNIQRDTVVSGCAWETERPRLMPAFHSLLRGLGQIINFSVPQIFLVCKRGITLPTSKSCCVDIHQVSVKSWFPTDVNGRQRYLRRQREEHIRYQWVQLSLFFLERWRAQQLRTQTLGPGCKNSSPGKSSFISYMTSGKLLNLSVCLICKMGKIIITLSHWVVRVKWVNTHQEFRTVPGQNKHLYGLVWWLRLCVNLTRPRYPDV